MKDENFISLREYLEDKIEHLKEKIKHLEEKIEWMQDSNNKALDLQAAEYERRIGESNNHLTKLKEIYAELSSEKISREVHDRDMKEVFGKIEVLTTSKDIGIGKGMAIASVIMFIFGLIGAAGWVISLFK